MNVNSCKRCKKLYQSYDRGSICPACQEELDREFVKVREYIYENARAGIKQICEETGVDEKTVFQFLREGRLELSNNAGFLRCDRCGKSIASGTLCADCKVSIHKELGRIIQASQPAPKPDVTRNTGTKMHITTIKRND